MKDKLKISSFKEIHHVALNENESETVNDSSVDNNSNNNSNNDFVSAMLFMCSVSSIAVLNATVY